MTSDHQAASRAERDRSDLIALVPQFNSSARL